MDGTKYFITTFFLYGIQNPSISSFGAFIFARKLLPRKMHDIVAGGKLLTFLEDYFPIFERWKVEDFNRYSRTEMKVLSHLFHEYADLLSLVVKNDNDNHVLKLGEKAGEEKAWRNVCEQAGVKYSASRCRKYMARHPSRAAGEGKGWSSQKRDALKLMQVGPFEERVMAVINLVDSFEPASEMIRKGKTLQQVDSEDFGPDATRAERFIARRGLRNFVLCFENHHQKNIKSFQAAHATVPLSLDAYEISCLCSIGAGLSSPIRTSGKDQISSVPRRRLDEASKLKLVLSDSPAVCKAAARIRYGEEKRLLSQRSLKRELSDDDSDSDGSTCRRRGLPRPTRRTKEGSEEFKYREFDEAKELVSVDSLSHGGGVNKLAKNLFSSLISPNPSVYVKKVSSKPRATKVTESKLPSKPKAQRKAEKIRLKSKKRSSEDERSHKKAKQKKKKKIKLQKYGDEAFGRLVKKEAQAQAEQLKSENSVRAESSFSSSLKTWSDAKRMTKRIFGNPSLRFSTRIESMQLLVDQFEPVNQVVRQGKHWDDVDVSVLGETPQEQRAAMSFVDHGLKNLILCFEEHFQGDAERFQLVHFDTPMNLGLYKKNCLCSELF